MVMSAPLKKKICLLGSYGVGKTSLVARFVHSMFADKYHTTVGVKIDKKNVVVDGVDLTLMLWDMAGEEEGAPVKLNQVRDASGYLLVADGTRGRTLDVARDIQRRVQGELGSRPFLLLVNKADLRDSWEIPDTAWADLTSAGWTVLETSAKSGERVEEAFAALSSRILKDQADESGSEEDD
jgi:small GTP-binding protein